MTSTYVNDLRLNEMATGDASGTWGTITNTNLELIGEALGYGTQDCFTSDADATTTVADGATDPARAMYFKVTSSATLSATRTLTIAPNTVSRLQFIENATTGSQSINISQGSGANVTIGSGETKAVYLDGAGSGAAVVDSFATFSVANARFADGSNSAPSISFTSDTNTGIYRGGTDILKFVTAGTDAITIDASQDVTLAGSLNFADNEKAIFGAGSDLQIYHDGTNSQITDSGTGSLLLRGEDVAVQSDDGQSMATFTKDGATTLFYDDVAKLATTSTGIDVTGTAVTDGLTVAGNVSIDGGTIKLDGNYPVGTGNVALGDTAGDSLASGSLYNVLLGSNAGTALTTGDGNVAIGYDALKTEDADGYNVAIGYRALETLNRGGEGYAVSIGKDAGRLISTGVANTIIGSEAGDVLSVGNQNVALGYASLSSDTQGNYSTAIGSGALSAQNFTSSTDNYNTAVGFNAGNVLTTGIQNTILGALAGDALTDADTNVAIGVSALGGDTKGNSSVAIGSSALRLQNFTSSTDVYNVAVGRAAGENVTTGIQNTIIGGLAGDSLTDADFNVAIGINALTTDTKGNKSVAIGDSALGNQNFTSSTDTFNTAVGYSAGVNVTTGIKNTLIGGLAGDAFTTGDENTIIGYFAGTSMTTSNSGNTMIGANAGQLVTSGTKNTILGRFNGNQDGLDIRTTSNNIVLSDGDGFPRLHYIGSWRGQSDTASSWGYILDNINATNPFGLLVRTTGSDDNDGSEAAIEFQAQGTNRFTVSNTGNVSNTNNSYGAISDIKLKEQITDASSQWNDIKSLTVRKYKMKDEVISKGDSDELWRLGVVAQEIESAGMNGLVEERIDYETDEGGNIVETGTTTKQVKYSVLYMKAVKALQEAMERIETLEAKVATLEGA